MYFYYDVVMGLVWSNDCEGYDSSSISTGRTSQVMIQSKMETDPPGWGLGHEANKHTSSKKNLIVQKTNNGRQMDNTGKRPGKCYRIMTSILLLGWYSTY